MAVYQIKSDPRSYIGDETDLQKFAANARAKGGDIVCDGETAFDMTSNESPLIMPSVDKKETGQAKTKTKTKTKIDNTKTTKVVNVESIESGLIPPAVVETDTADEINRVSKTGGVISVKQTEPAEHLLMPDVISGKPSKE